MPATRRALLFASTLFASPAFAQQQPGPNYPTPRLIVVTPCGAKAGTTVEVTVAGQDLEDTQQLLFSDPRIKAERVAAAPAVAADPKNPRQAGNMRAQQGAITAAGTFKVTVPAGVPVGAHDVRAVNAWGVSNPRAFVVGDQQQAVEREPNNDQPEAQTIDLNSVVFGTIAAPTDVDFFSFAGKRGVKVVVACLTGSIDSKLQPIVQLFDGSGTQLAANRNYSRDDAVLDAVLPADGTYIVRVAQFTYTAGGPDYFYRLNVTTAPWIDAVFPPVVVPGVPNAVTVYGRNLTGGVPDPKAVIDGRPLEKVTVTVTPPASAEDLQRLAFRGLVPPHAGAVDGFEFRMRNDAGASNPFLLTFATAPVVLDNGANDTAETAQPVNVPCEICGRIEKKNDRDWYVFAAKKGEVLSIEAFGDRIGSPIDLYFTLSDANGKPVAGGEFDDNPETLSPNQWFNRTDDPARVRFTAPADGKYRLMVSSREASVQAGPRDLYRVRVTPERPDFRLVVMPALLTQSDATVLGRGGRQYLNVYVTRNDGFEGPIALTAVDLPQGVTCAPQVVGPGVRQAALVLEASADAPVWAGMIGVQGKATVNGSEVVREARPASVTWGLPGQNQQLNVPTVSRLDRGLALAVRDPGPFELAAKEAKFLVQAGDKIALPLKQDRRPDFKAAVAVAGVNLPKGITLVGDNSRGNNNNAGVPLPADKPEATVSLDVKADVTPGTYTVVLRGQAQMPPTKETQAKTRTTFTVTGAVTPITVTVLPKQLATLTVSPTEPKVSAGQATTLTVKIARMYDFAGEFTVELVIPPEGKGLSADKATVAAGKDEAALTVRADPSVAGGQVKAVVRATAHYEGKAIVQETRLTLTVARAKN
jgi:hypothetical protein